MSSRACFVLTPAQTTAPCLSPACRPKLGGKLVLPPWGSGGAAAEAAVATAIAVDDTAEGAAQPGGEALEGGLVVGADLARARVRSAGLGCSSGHAVCTFAHLDPLWL